MLSPKSNCQKSLSFFWSFGLYEMGLNEQDIYDLRMWFEEALNRSTKKVDKPKKMRMRRKVRDEIFFLLTWEKPSPSAIINRWEDRLFDVFQVMPFGFKEQLLNLLIDKIGKT
jgi:hypothetical protein